MIQVKHKCGCRWQTCQPNGDTVYGGGIKVQTQRDPRDEERPRAHTNTAKRSSVITLKLSKPSCPLILFLTPSRRFGSVDEALKRSRYYPISRGLPLDSFSRVSQLSTYSLITPPTYCIMPSTLSLPELKHLQVSSPLFD